MSRHGLDDSTPNDTSALSAFWRLHLTHGRSATLAAQTASKHGVSIGCHQGALAQGGQPAYGGQSASAAHTRC